MAAILGNGYYSERRLPKDHFVLNLPCSFRGKYFFFNSQKVTCSSYVDYNFKKGAPKDHSIKFGPNWSNSFMDEDFKHFSLRVLCSKYVGWWQPSLLADWVIEYNSERGPGIDHFIKVWYQISQTVSVEDFNSFFHRVFKLCRLMVTVLVGVLDYRKSE